MPRTKGCSLSNGPSGASSIAASGWPRQSAYASQPNRRRQGVAAVNWSHPAYANRHIFARNDERSFAPPWKRTRALWKRIILFAWLSPGQCCTCLSRGIRCSQPAAVAIGARSVSCPALEGFAECGLGFVADSAGDFAEAFRTCAQHAGSFVHAPAGEVLQGWLTHQFPKPGGEASPRHSCAQGQ